MVVKTGFKSYCECAEINSTNDIQNVGRTARHHTFFEMLGNSQFGDYFKRSKRFSLRGNFLTSEEWMGIDKDRLYVSVYTDDARAYEY